MNKATQKPSSSQPAKGRLVRAISQANGMPARIAINSRVKHRVIVMTIAAVQRGCVKAAVQWAVVTTGWALNGSLSKLVISRVQAG